MQSANISKALRVLCVVIAAVALQSTPTNGANILGLFSSHSPSHFIVHMSVMKALAEKGHNITVVSSAKPKVTHPSIRHIVILPTEEQERELEEGVKLMSSKRNNIVTMLKNMFTSAGMIVSMQVDVIKDERFTRLYNEKFDLVIMGYFFNDYQLGVAAKFNCPIIVNWMSNSFAMIDELVGNPQEVAYVPNMNVATTAGEAMGFGKRMQNYLSSKLFGVFGLVMNYKMEGYYNELFPKENYPSYEDMKKNVSLLFCNSHFSEGIVRPNVPALVEIGGIQIKDKPDPLPKDIAEYLNSAKENGAILFSLGSNVKSSNMKPETMQIIFKVLSGLKQKVIWKWENPDNVPGKSPNILYKKWLPQDDILAHPNLKLFITHAGKGGIAEAQYHAVPMVALPIFGDQNSNAEKMTLAGYGQHLDLLSLTEKDLKATVLEVLGNPKYKANIQRFSDLYRDRPLTAKQNVVYWTEYVLRHHGAKHMQSPLVHLNYIQSSSLDIIGFLVLIAFVVIKLLKLFFRFVCSKLCGGRKNSKTKLSNSNKKVKKQ